MKKQKRVEEEDKEDVEDRDYIAVKDIMNPDVVWAKPDDTIESVAKMMYKNRIEGIFMLDIDENMKIKKGGVITTKDIVYKVVAKGKDPKKVKVKDVATKGLITISPDASLEEAAKLMRSKDIRRLAVEDEKGIIVGVITESDIARASPEIIRWMIERRTTYRDFIQQE
ncbi:MAG: CBS domain-containing protein [Candidatus Altarchaeaceae archaeon]